MSNLHLPATSMLLMAALLPMFPSGMSAAEGTLLNPTKRTYAQELIRLPFAAPENPGTWVVTEDGKPIPFELVGKDVWISTSFAPGQRRAYATVPGVPAATPAQVKLNREGADWILDNGKVAVRIPAATDRERPHPAPIIGFRRANGPWLGKGWWDQPPQAARFSTTAIGQAGAVLSRVVVRYDFAPRIPGEKSWYEAEITLAPGWDHVEVVERSALGRNDGWHLDLACGWKPTLGISKPFSEGFWPAEDGVKAPAPQRALTAPAGQPYQDPSLFINLVPRWNQHSKDGWFFAAADDATAVGCLVARAGSWDWPHDNAIAVRVAPTGDQARLDLPTWRGQRRWFLLVGDRAVADKAQDYCMRHAVEPLDKLNRDFILDWPGKDGPATAFSGEWIFAGEMNPTGFMRNRAKKLLAKPLTVGDLGLLTNTQVLFHADTYGSYWNHWSPENPNFFSDFIKVPVLQMAGLKEHPRYKELVTIAVAKIREDLYHSVTLPGGAGQECPGYQGGGLGVMRAIAPTCVANFGFDPLADARYLAGVLFLKKISQPDGAIRRDLPMGDTHPGKDGPKPVEVTAAEAATWTSEEFPGFGAILRNHPGTPDETHLAFKGGPNRCHYHGDQLAIHLCFGAKPVAVDHHCSYKPRAGQEHMHNRLSFSSAELPWANMDGYERMLGWKTGPIADIAVAQVESSRLRAVAALPPEKWHQEWPLAKLAKPLVYRRTVILLKGAADGKDAVVLRDQWTGAEALTTTFNLHVRANALADQGAAARFDEELVAHRLVPAAATFAVLPWKHANGGGESTQGLRWSVTTAEGEFLTVLLPGTAKAEVKAIPGGVQVGRTTVMVNGFFPDLAYEPSQPLTAVAITGEGKGETLRYDELSLDRPQGDIGLFVPDAGYPFGPIPDWLIKQRASAPRPDWAR